MSKQERKITAIFLVLIVVLLWILRRKSPVTPPTQAPIIAPFTGYISSGGGGGGFASSSNNVISSEIDLAGVAEAGARFGINVNSGRTFYVDSSGNWQPSLLPVSSYSPLTGTFAAVHLDNAQSFTSDVTITGVLLANHYNLTVLTDLENYGGIEIYLSIVANNKVRVTARNNTGNTISVPQLSISALRIS